MNEILGGGIGFLVKDSFTIVSITPADHTSFEALSIVIKLPSGNLTVYCIYRHPPSKKRPVAFSTFITEFQSFLTVAANTPNHFIITGDFNIHVNKESDPNQIKFTDLLDSFNLNQLVSVATHVDKNTLDLVITSSDPPICHSVSVLPVAPSDHFPVISILNLPTPLPRPLATHGIRRTKSINIELFIQDLTLEPLISEPPTTLDELLITYNATLTRLLDKHAPLINKPVSSRPSNPWFTPFLSNLKTTRRRLEKMWLKSKDSDHLSRLRQISNFYHHSVVLAKKAYNAALVSDCKSQPRKLWQTINTLLHRKPPTALPSAESNTSLPDTFSSFFTDKISKLHSSLTSNANHCSSPHTDPPYAPAVLDNFNPVTEDEIVNFIRQSPDKQCDLDPIPTSLLKQCVHILAPVITTIVNLSLRNGTFPSDFKRAVVTPLLKKPSLDKESLSNYRPISNLSFLSKLTERIVKDRITDHLAANSMFNSFQSAYTKFHSTETTLLALHDDLIKAIDKQQVTGLTLLDLSAAFDTIDHSILLKRLSSWFGFRGKVLSWFTSYLHKRTFSVSCSGLKSSPTSLVTGVPQGSVLGPILFILYTTPLSSIISQPDNIMRSNDTHVNHHLYADDTQLYISFHPTDYSDAHSCLQRKIASISSWMASNFLSLNPSKTEFLIVGLPTQLAKIYQPALVLPDNTTVSPVTTARNLGIIFDCSLSFKHQIKSLSKTCMYHCRDLRRIRSTLDFETARTIATALVHSKLDYCNSLYYHLPASQLNKLQVIQNSLARAVTKTPRFCHISPVLRSLHWLKIEQRIEYKIISLTYTALQQNSPSYLIDKIKLQSSRSTRSSSVVTLHRPSVKLETGKRSFTFAAPSLWNSLPTAIRQPSDESCTSRLALSRNSFHRHLKTHLFSHSYPP